MLSLYLHYSVFIDDELNEMFEEMINDKVSLVLIVYLDSIKTLMDNKIYFNIDINRVLIKAK